MSNFVPSLPALRGAHNWTPHLKLSRQCLELAVLAPKGARFASYGTNRYFTDQISVRFGSPDMSLICPNLTYFGAIPDIPDTADIGGIWGRKSMPAINQPVMADLTPDIPILTPNGINLDHLNLFPVHFGSQSASTIISSQLNPVLARNSVKLDISGTT